MKKLNRTLYVTPSQTFRRIKYHRGDSFHFCLTTYIFRLKYNFELYPVPNLNCIEQAINGTSQPVCLCLNWGDGTENRFRLQNIWQTTILVCCYNGGCCFLLWKTTQFLSSSKLNLFSFQNSFNAISAAPKTTVCLLSWDIAVVKIRKNWRIDFHSSQPFISQSRACT